MLTKDDENDDRNFFPRKQPWSTIKDQLLAAYLTPCLAKPAHHVNRILIADRLLSAHFHSWFFSEEFRELLDPVQTDARGWMRKGSFQVAPLTLMKTDVLECLESSLSDFSLAQLLADYTAASPDRMTSLHEFLASNAERYPVQPNERLCNIAREVLNACNHRFFPDRAKEIDSLCSPIGGEEAAERHRQAKRVDTKHGEVFA